MLAGVDVTFAWLTMIVAMHDADLGRQANWLASGLENRRSSRSWGFESPAFRYDHLCNVRFEIQKGNK